MILGLVHRPSPHKSNKYVWSLECDQCHLLFEKPKSTGPDKKKHHFCSRKCLDDAHSRTGVLFSHIASTIEHRHGADFHRRILALGQQVAHTPEVAEKKRQTMLRRYGVETAVQIPHVRAAADAVRGSPESVAKRKATTKARFGVESVLSLPEVRALANTPEKCRQRHETMKRNGSYFNSRGEHAFHAWLVERFGDVERQVVVNTWPIDFHVKSTDTYVQFDGAYWHGLDRPVEVIARFKTPRDRTILRKFQIDREQDAWFEANNMRLIRVTDRQFKSGTFTL